MADNLTLDRMAMKDRSTAHLRIYVGSLVESTTVDELYEHFIPYGKINGIVLNKNFAFVQFEEESSAQEAIKKGHGSTFKGRTLIVRTAQTNEKRKETEVVTVTPAVPPALALSDNIPVVEDDPADELYDNYGNYVGDPGIHTDYREEEYEEPANWNNEPVRGGPRGKGPRAAMRTRGGRGRPAPPYSERTPGPGAEWSDRGYDRFQRPINNYPPRAVPVPERNDCEIIVVSKNLTEYAEYIESRLKRLGIVVDLLFPMEDVPIGKVLGNIASRGCLYAILVMPQNQEHRSLTLTILHGLPQEHRNMPLEDALQLLSRNFQEVQRGGTSGREAVYALLGQLADGRTLTVLQYDKVIEYLQERREQQVKIELGEPITAPANKTQTELQQRILTILNDKKLTTEKVEKPPATPQNKLLNDPTVKKALDSILQKFV